MVVTQVFQEKCISEVETIYFFFENAIKGELIRSSPHLKFQKRGKSPPPTNRSMRVTAKVKLCHRQCQFWKKKDIFQGPHSPEKTWKKLLFLLLTWKMGVEVSSRNDKSLENFFGLSEIHLSQNLNEKYQFLIWLYLSTFISHWNLI